ncbi:MAG: hypothetical protein LKI18_08115 [Prevotella sp.]|jgi:cellobiose phosphorylase|nr:hypothetical protein [Prevotella sp.]
MERIIFLAIMIMLIINIPASARKDTSRSPIGFWKTDHTGLPCFQYTGSIPFFVKLSNGDSVKLSPDPWFVLGNYQLTVFAHVSGKYELITGQRAWGRMNQGDLPNTGENNAQLEIIGDDGTSNKVFQLVGESSLSADSCKSQRTFGCGYANYQYKAGKMLISRTMSVKPSTSPDNGTSAFLLTVVFKNTTGHNQHIRYTEAIRANYQTIMQQFTPMKNCKVKYPVSFNTNEHTVMARFKAKTDDPMLFQSKDGLSKYEGYPPVLFMDDLSHNGVPGIEKRNLSLTYNMFLKRGEKKKLRIIIGYSMERSYSNISQIRQELSDSSDFSTQWKRVLPQFPSEPNLNLRRELTWHAYMLEAMATYSDYYHETKIPQGTIYDYSWGQHASARDNFQHALATIYYNPELTKSIIRYMMKRTLPSGEIMLIEYGNGFAESGCYQTSDQQLWFFLLLSEYLRVTGDYKFLNEKVPCYPVKNMPEYTIADYTKRCFEYLRYQVGTGSHGLVRLLNSDWCDNIYYTIPVLYNAVQPMAESHMNTAMALAILPSLADQLEKASVDKTFISSIRQWRHCLFDAYMKDWGNRPYPRRMYFAGRTFGENNMFLEHLGFTLLIKDLPEQRKSSLYTLMQKKLYAGEKLGAREQEKPELTNSNMEVGSRENGGFWYSLNGPVIAGVSTFDKQEAKLLLSKMSLNNLAKEFPQYWSSYWSAADNVESSLMPSEGLPDQTAHYSDIPIACAHVHAWMLYCWYFINMAK